MISSRSLLVRRALVVCASAAFVTGCSTPKVSESLYRSSEVGVSKQVVRCRVTEAREILLRDDESDAQGGGMLGAIVGGVTGGLLGGKIGGGTGSDIAATVGAGVGAAAAGVAGTKMADKLSERKGVEYSYILSDGSEGTHVQELLPTDRMIAVGETCRLQVAPGGRNRLLPAEQLAEEMYAPKKTTLQPLP
jgi:outer membrane lipoprotein SlyB